MPRRHLTASLSLLGGKTKGDVLGDSGGAGQAANDAGCVVAVEVASVVGEQ